MPRWSLNELKNLREVSFRSVPVADLESNFEFYGGIPRFVLELSEKDRSDRYRDQLGKVTVQQLIEIFKTPAYTDLPSQKMTSYLVHVVPRCEIDANVEGYDTFACVFASEAISAELAQRFMEDQHFNASISPQL